MSLYENSKVMEEKSTSEETEAQISRFRFKSPPEEFFFPSYSVTAEGKRARRKKAEGKKHKQHHRADYLETNDL